MRELARSPRLANLRTLLLDRNGLTDAAAEALLASPHLTKLRSLDLDDNALSERAKEALKERFERTAD